MAWRRLKRLAAMFLPYSCHILAINFHLAPLSNHRIPLVWPIVKHFLGGNTYICEKALQERSCYFSGIRYTISLVTDRLICRPRPRYKAYTGGRERLGRRRFVLSPVAARWISRQVMGDSAWTRIWDLGLGFLRFGLSIRHRFRKPERANPFSLFSPGCAGASMPQRG